MSGDWLMRLRMMRGRVAPMKKMHMKSVSFGFVAVFLLCSGALGEQPFMANMRQVAPMRQDSLKVPAPGDIQRLAPSQAGIVQPADNGGASTSAPQAGLIPLVNGYDPAGRRDPFAPVLDQLTPGQVDMSLPPLQRVGLTDMNLIAVIWGAYGYTAMLQMPDGNGYAVRKGTRVGPNNGVVSAITEKGIVVQERFTDVYGRKQEREYVKLLHPKEASE
jgi:type IV pilus assembly protein PilP